MPTILAVGDLMVGDSAASPGYGFASRYGSDGLTRALEPAATLLRSGDLVIGNLEVTLSRTGAVAGQYRTLDMRGWPRFASELRAAGFTALNLANNHALQHGPEAFAETQALVDAAGILCVGLRGRAPWTCAPVKTTLSDSTSVGLLGYCLRPRQFHRDLDPPFAEGTEAAILDDVRRLRREAGLVIVSLHWGEDYVERPSEDEARFAHALIDAGCSVLLGHHPHVLRAVERRATGVIAYSLGNFIGDQTWHPDLAQAMVLGFDVADQRITRVTAHPTRLLGDYSVAIAESPVDVTDSPVHPLPRDAYRLRADRRGDELRRAKHKHALRNLWRSDFRQMAQLVLRTVTNRFRSLRERLR